MSGDSNDSVVRPRLPQGPVLESLDEIMEEYNLDTYRAAIRKSLQLAGYDV